MPRILLLSGNKGDGARLESRRTLLATIRAYRNINDRTQREIDEAIESLAALEQIYQQLVTDDLPRTRGDWLEKIDADLNQGLRALLQQIDVDRREITRGLDSINAVLAGVPFRHDSHLAIEPRYSGDSASSLTGSRSPARVPLILAAHVWS